MSKKTCPSDLSQALSPASAVGARRAVAAAVLLRGVATLTITLICVLLLSRNAAAQGATTDIIRGRVLDPSGAPVAGARLEARDLDSGLRRRTTSTATGQYTIVFADGSGRYGVEASAGAASVRVLVAREADEEVLVADLRLGTPTYRLDAVEVTAHRPGNPGRAEAGSVERAMSGELLERLPLSSYDPGTLASLTPGVTTVGEDGLGSGGFSVAGQRSTQNQVTLDGASFAALLSGSGLGGAGVPAEGIRATRVITSTYDVGRGQFSGGQVEMTTRSGTNVPRGSLTYFGRDDRLEGHAKRTAWAEGFQQHRVSGGAGGALVPDRFFYYLSATGLWRSDTRFALEPRDPSGFSLAGVHADSVARFLDILQRRYGFDLAGRTGGFSRSNRAATVLGRLDYVLPRHTFSLRTFGSSSRESNAFLRVLDVRDRGGEQSARGAAAVATATSHLGDSWVNELRFSLTHDQRDLVPYLTIPGARVRVASETEAGSQMAILGFGGNSLLPRSSREGLFEVANELSWLWGTGHRVKVGAFFGRYAFSDETTANRSGSFTFESLADFEVGRPTSFTRTISSGPVDGSGWNAAFYAGDAWRITPRLQLTYGLRLEAGGLATRPEAISLADSLFSLPTDHLPEEVRVSPRVGFSWRLNADRQPLRLLRGGIGEFRGRIPPTLYADALRRGRDFGGQVGLVCLGEGSVPTADYRRFAEDPSTAPDSCTGPGAGTSGRPIVVGFGPGFAAPRSWRASLGYQSQLWRLLGASVDVTYSRGVSQYRIQDLNLRTAPAFILVSEAGRPVFADPSEADARSGRVGISSARVHPEFAHMFLATSDARSEAAQVSLALNGLIPALGLAFQSTYTLSYARDESSFSFGGASQGFAGTPTRGNPNKLEWATSDMSRRHALVTVAGLPVTRFLELSIVGRAVSGVPFTPMVSSDINGDGMANDAAFVFEPGNEAAEGIRELLDGAPRNVRRCLERQMGSIAARNSCRTGWNYAVDLRAAIRPAAGQGRITAGVEFFNVASGLDLLLHGRNALHGWGEAGWWVDPVLLYPRSFDPVARKYSYEVNPAFGQLRAHRTSEGLPFAVQVSARVALGPRPRADALGFADLGGPGMAAGTLARIAMTGAAGGNSAGADAAAIDDLDEPGHGPGPGALITRALPEPLTSLLALADSIGLSPEQRARVEEIRDSLLVTNEPIRAEVTRVFVAAFRGGGEPVSPEALFATIGPRLNEGRLNVQAALGEVRSVLTAEQWERVPVSLRESVSTTTLKLTPPTP